MNLTPECAPALYAADPDDPLVCAVYYHRGLGWTWFLLEYDPETRHAFGLVDGFVEEMGYFDLAELEDCGAEAVPFERVALSVARLRRAA